MSAVTRFGVVYCNVTPAAFVFSVPGISVNIISPGPFLCQIPVNVPLVIVADASTVVLVL